MTDEEQAAAAAAAYGDRMIESGASPEASTAGRMAYYDGWLQSREPLRPLIDRISRLLGIE